MKKLRSKTRSIAARTVAVMLCGSFAISLTACNKRSYKGEVDKFIDVVGSELGGSDYVLESVEDASELFFETRDLDETREFTEWLGKKDTWTDFVAEKEYNEGLFYRGEYKELWDQYEESIRNEETLRDVYGKDNKDVWEDMRNPTNESLLTLLEHRSFGLSVRATELLRPYSTEDAVYYSNQFYNLNHRQLYTGMRVIFKSTSDAKEYWDHFMDIDDSYRYSHMGKQSNDDLADFELEERYQEYLDAFHDMDEENYQYDEKKNEGHMTLYWGMRDTSAGGQTFHTILFAIKISGREVTMLTSYLYDPDANLKKLGKVYEKLDLNNPLKTEMIGVDENTSQEEMRQRVLNPDPVEGFLNSYNTFAINKGIGVNDWFFTTRMAYFLPLVRYPDHAAWVLFEYEDPQDYLDDLQS